MLSYEGCLKNILELLIMKTYEKWEFKMAWELAMEKRCCPPDEILFSPVYKEQVTRHIRFCPSCKELLSDEQPYTSNFFKQQLKALPKETQKEVIPGQIWSVKSELGDWGPKSRYYIPPLVLVLKQGENMDNAVLVSQIYDDITLFGPGDIPLGENIIGFAESWNLYTLRKTDLEICFGTADDEVIQQVVSERDKDIPPIKNTTLLYFFRNLEIEVGYFFSSMAVSSLMSEYESLKVVYDVGEQLFPESSEWFEKFYSKLSPEIVEELLGKSVNYADQYSKFKIAARGGNLIQIRKKINRTGSVKLSVEKDGSGILKGGFTRPKAVKVVVGDSVSGDIYRVRIQGGILSDYILLNAGEKLQIQIENMKTKNLRLIIFGSFQEG